MDKGLTLSPLLFMIVMEVISREFRVALLWELLYTDDLAVIAETEEELIKKLNDWKDNVVSKGMRVTHTHTFNGPFSGTIWVSRYQKGKTTLDFIEARDSECSGISWAVCFLQARCPSCRPTNSVKALKAERHESQYE